MKRRIILRIIFFGLVLFGIYSIYYSTVQQKNFVIFTNPEGPDTSDYFLNED
jgi:hypothetical protein